MILSSSWYSYLFAIVHTHALAQRFCLLVSFLNFFFACLDFHECRDSLDEKKNLQKHCQIIFGCNMNQVCEFFFWFGHLVYWLYAFKCAQCTFVDKLNLNSISSFQSKPLHDSSAFLFQRMFAHVPALPKYMHISVHVRSLNSQSHFKKYMALFKSLSKLTNELIELK